LLVLLGAAGALGQEFTGGPSGDKLEQEGDEVQVKASNFNDTRVQDLLTPNNLDPLESFRCGMFYSPPTVGDKPRAKIFILPKRFKIEKSTFEVIKDLDWTGGTCDTLKDGQPDDSMDQYCYTLFKKFTDNNDMDTGSKVRDPKKYAMGDDLCEYLTKVGIPKRALPPNAKKGTENGIQVGFYYNKCNDKKWYDTKLRMNSTVCCSKCETCKGKADWQAYTPTYQSC